MPAAHVALCVTLIFAGGRDAARPASQETQKNQRHLSETSSIHLHQHGQLSKVNEQGPFQTQLRALDAEFESNQPSLIDENKAKTDDVIDKLQDYVNKSLLVPKSYTNWVSRAQAFKNKMEDQHSKLDTIMQRHFKWGGKQVWHGPLRDELDNLDSNQIREYILTGKQRNDIKARHIIDERARPLINLKPRSSGDEHDDNATRDRDVEAENDLDNPEPGSGEPAENEPKLPNGLEFPRDAVARQFAVQWYNEMIQFPVKKREGKFKDAMKYWIPKNAESHGHEVEDAKFVYEFFQNVKESYLAGDDLTLAGGNPTGVAKKYKDGPDLGEDETDHDDDVPASGKKRKKGTSVEDDDGGHASPAGWVHHDGDVPASSKKQKNGM